MNTARNPRRMARPLVEADAGAQSGAQAGSDAEAPDVKRTTKQSLLIGMLEREVGASLPEMVEATGWQAHTVRAALTGLRKKGHTLERSSVEGVTRYRIALAAA